MALSRRKKLVFALVTMSLAVFAAIAMLLVADLVLHARAERSAGLNRHGYRGPVAGRKQPGELRVVMLGGSTVFGYGLVWEESIPVKLETRLKQRLTRPVSVVNLGFNNEGAFAFVPNLEDFAYLDYDVIVLYEGYNDLPGDEGVNRSVYRRDSAVYRLTGYYAILPLYLDEKAKMLRYGGDLGAAYQTERDIAAGRTVFRPTLAQRTSASAVEAIAAVTKALNGQFEETPAPRPPAIKATDSKLGCTFPYVTYCESMAAAIRFALDHGKGIVVATQPLMRDGRSRELHILQQGMLGKMVSTHFGEDRRVAWTDLSTLIDLRTSDLTFDGMHLRAAGNDVVASALIDPVLAVAVAAGRNP